MAVVGWIARAHGIRGQVVVNPETDFPEHRFQQAAELFVKREDHVERLVVASVRFHRARPVIGLEGIDDRNSAEALAGAELRVPRDSLVPLPEGVYYWHDLIGCTVETVDGRPVGAVVSVDGTMSLSRLVVGGPHGEIMIPLVSDICPTIDTSARRIVVDPPEGLLELNDAVRHRHDLSGDGRTGRGRGDRRSSD